MKESDKEMLARKRKEALAMFTKEELAAFSDFLKKNAGCSRYPFPKATALTKKFDINIIQAVQIVTAFDRYEI